MTWLCVGLNIQREWLATGVSRIQYVFLDDRGSPSLEGNNLLLDIAHGMETDGAMVRLYCEFECVCLVYEELKEKDLDPGLLNY